MKTLSLFLALLMGSPAHAATHDYVLDNATGASFRADINSALSAIVSQNSNTTAPSTTFAYMTWADTTSGMLKIRNAANNAWVSLIPLAGLTASRAAVTDSSGAVAVSSVTSTELGYISGSTGATGTGNIVRSASPTLTGTIAGASQTLSGTLGVTGAVTLTAGLVGNSAGTLPASGNIGQYSENASSLANFTSGTRKDCMSRAFGTGVWLVWGTIYFNRNSATVTANDYHAFLSGTAGDTTNDQAGALNNANWTGAVSGSYSNFTLTVGPVLVRITSTDVYINNGVARTGSTVYLKGYPGTFTGGPVQCLGQLAAIRIF